MTTESKESAGTNEASARNEESEKESESNDDSPVQIVELLDLKLRQRDGLLVIRLAFYVSLQVLVFLLLGLF